MTCSRRKHQGADRLDGFEVPVATCEQPVALAVEDRAPRSRTCAPATGAASRHEPAVAALSAARALTARNISDRSASHGFTQTAMSTPRTSPSRALLQANRASPPATTSPPRCPTAITPSRCHCSSAMTFSPADHCSPSQPVSMSRGVRRAACGVRRAACGVRTLQDIQAGCKSIPDELETGALPFAAQSHHGLGSGPAQPADKHAVGNRPAGSAAATAR